MLTVTRAQMSTVIVFWEGLVSEGKYPGGQMCGHGL